MHLEDISQSLKTNALRFHLNEVGRVVRRIDRRDLVVAKSGTEVGSESLFTEHPAPVLPDEEFCGGLHDSVNVPNTANCLTAMVKTVYIMLLALDYRCKYARVYNKAEAERRRRQPHQCNQSSRNNSVSPQKAPSLPAPRPGGGGRPVTLALALTITFLSCASRTSAPAQGGAANEHAPGPGLAPPLAAPGGARPRRFPSRV